MIKKTIIKEKSKEPVKVQAMKPKLDVIIKNTVPKTTVKPTIVKPQIVAKPASKPVQVSSKPSLKSSPKLLPKIETKVKSKPIAVRMNANKSRLQEVTSEHEAYFVYLKNPLEYRRQMLECSRKILFCLKSHQKLFFIRQKKLEEMRKLKSVIRELLYLNKKFNEKLPKYNTTFLGETPTETKIKLAPAKLPVAKKPFVAPAEKTEMERLEESLANIEKKLKTLQ